MQTAGLGSLVVNGATAAFLIQINAVPVGHLRKGQGLGSGVEVLNDFVFSQPLENDLGVFLKVKFTDQSHANQVAGFDFHRQTATCSPTVTAQLLVKLDPRFKILHVGGFAGDFHRAFLTVDGVQILRQIRVRPTH